MIAYQTDENGFYVGPVECDRSPLEPDVFIIPGGALTVPPPNAPEGSFIRWDGESWLVEEPPNPEAEEPLTWDDIRFARDFFLSQSDWTRIDDAPLTSAQRDAWASYRQELRDVPQMFSSPEEVVWPTAP